MKHGLIFDLNSIEFRCHMDDIIVEFSNSEKFIEMARTTENLNTNFNGMLHPIIFQDSTKAHKNYWFPLMHYRVSAEETIFEQKRAMKGILHHHVQNYYILKFLREELVAKQTALETFKTEQTKINEETQPTEEKDPKQDTTTTTDKEIEERTHSIIELQNNLCYLV